MPSESATSRRKGQRWGREASDKLGRGNVIRLILSSTAPRGIQYSGSRFSYLIPFAQALAFRMRTTQGIFEAVSLTETL